ncbi:MAG TPA: DUF5666 domain-containing protein [Candidatus Eisenbacteria bacterium]|nr:DUF5666 domain-containing protein [Candidatus Eisenbacteria bacterium]
MGIAAVVLAGCGSFGSSATASSSSAKASPSPGRGNGAAGQLVRLSRTSMTLNDQGSSVTVSYDSSTTVLQSGTGEPADLTPGVCVTATGLKETTGAVTATTVQVMLNMNGNCTQPAGGFGGAPSPGQSPRAGRQSPGPGASPGGPGDGVPANLTFVRGKVSSVKGTTITVEQDTGGPVTVTVPATARITRTVSSPAARLAVGECITASGQRDSSGTIKARAIMISAPGPNGCAAGRGFGGPGGGRPSPTPSQAALH